MRQAVNVTLPSKNLAFSQLSSSGASANEPHAGWQLSALINATLLAISVLCFQNIVPIRHCALHVQCDSVATLVGN